MDKVQKPSDSDLYVLYTLMWELGTNTQLFSGNVKERSHSRDLDIHARLILKCRNRIRGMGWIQLAQGKI
jgi:hypothetical protein